MPRVRHGPPRPLRRRGSGEERRLPIMSLDDHAQTPGAPWYVRAAAWLTAPVLLVVLALVWLVPWLPLQIAIVAFSAGWTVVLAAALVWRVRSTLAKYRSETPTNH